MSSFHDAFLKNICIFLKYNIGTDHSSTISMEYCIVSIKYFDVNHFIEQEISF